MKSLQEFFARFCVTNFKTGIVPDHRYPEPSRLGAPEIDFNFIAKIIYLTQGKNSSMLSLVASVLAYLLHSSDVALPQGETND